MSISISVGFTLTGNTVNPNTITQLLRITPSKTWQAGDSIQGLKIRRKHNGWNFALPPSENIDVGEEVRKLVNRLRPYHMKISELCATYKLEAEVNCLVRIKGERPAIYLDSESIQFMASIGAEFDVDIYVVP